MTSAEIERRRVVALHLLDALCAHYPDRYVALIIQPRDVTDDEPDVAAQRLSRRGCGAFGSQASVCAHRRPDPRIEGMRERRLPYFGTGL
jgi:hypothetical protein